MTFNATLLSVEMLLRAGFVERQIFRLRPGMERRRKIMLPPKIDDMLNNIADPNFPSVWASIALDKFISGNLVTISRAAEAASDLKLLTDVDEVWTLAVRSPRTFQARLLGRFVQKDVFVGLDFALREDLAQHENYHARANAASESWDEMTGGVRPIRSPSNADYLSPHFRDLDDEQDG